MIRSPRDSHYLELHTTWATQGGETGDGYALPRSWYKKNAVASNPRSQPVSERTI